MRDHNFRIAQSDECDEQTNSGGGAEFQAIGNSIYNLLTNSRERENQKQHTGQKDDAERGLPRDSSADNDGISEIGVERHAGSESNRIIGPQTHHQSCHCRGNAGGEEHSIDGHSGFGENSWIDDDDVSHRHKRGQAAQHFLADGGAILGELEPALEH